MCGFSPELTSDGADALYARGSSLLLLGLGISFTVGGSVLLCKALVLLFDLGELPHVLEEVGRSFKSDKKLGLLGALSTGTTLVLAGHRDGLGANALELSVLVPKNY